MRSSDEHYNNILGKMEKKRGERMMRKKYVVSAVSCLAVVLVAGVVINQTDLFNKQEDADAQYAKDTDLEWSEGLDGGEDADIAFEDVEPLMSYYVPNSDGTYTLEQDSLLVEDGETYQEDVSLNSAVIRYLELCKENGYGDGVTLGSAETETIEGTEETNGDGMVSYKVEYSIASIYLEGDAIEDETLIGLVNSIIDSTVITEGNYRYVKVYLNGEAVSINGEYPEQGFERFDIEVMTY